MRIGIFGGSFNPIHNKHINIAKELIENDKLDKIIYVPVGNRYSKRDLILDEYRKEMIEIAIKNSRLNYIEVSDVEMQEKRIYTYETLNYFKEKYIDDEIYFIMGLDNLEEFDTWKNYEYMLENFKFIVIKRKCKDNKNVDEILNKYDKYRDRIIISQIKEQKISSTDIREKINDVYKEIDFLTNKLKQDVDLNKLLKDKDSFIYDSLIIEKSLNKKVYEYILKNNLYNNITNNKSN